MHTGNRRSGLGLAIDAGLGHLGRRVRRDGLSIPAPHCEDDRSSRGASGTPLDQPGPNSLPRNSGLLRCGHCDRPGPLTSRGRTHTDFGPGFYTTTILRQAQMWAAQLAATRLGTTAAVVQFVISREDLAGLDALAFVRSDFHADDFWSLVHHCRQGGSDHRRVPTAPHYSNRYDVVYGPVAAFWNQRMAIVDADQVSFHTLRAEAVLNRSSRTRII